VSPLGQPRRRSPPVDFRARPILASSHAPFDKVTSVNADVATCVLDGRRMVAPRVVTIAASIPEAAIRPSGVHRPPQVPLRSGTMPVTRIKGGKSVMLRLIAPE
jgi:hypothetical protein